MLLGVRVASGADAAAHMNGEGDEQETKQDTKQPSASQQQPSQQQQQQPSSSGATAGATAAPPEGSPPDVDMCDTDKDEQEAKQKVGDMCATGHCWLHVQLLFCGHCQHSSNAVEYKSPLPVDGVCAE